MKYLVEFTMGIDGSIAVEADCEASASHIAGKIITASQLNVIGIKVQASEVTILEILPANEILS